MKNDLVIKKCNICGAIIKVINNKGIIKCCGQDMQVMVPNSVDCSVEKHVPTYERVEDEIYVKVNHVMEKEHYIEWITLVADNKECTTILYPEQDADARFKYIPGSTIYAYCNKHGLWKVDVE